MLKGTCKKSIIRSVSPEKSAKTSEDDACDNKVPALPPECERSETEGKDASPNLSSQDLNVQQENVISTTEIVKVKEEMLPDPLNVTLIPSTATKQAPKLSPRKVAKTNGTLITNNDAQTANLRITPSLPNDTKLTLSCAGNDQESSRTQSTVSSTTTTAVQPNVTKQVRPTSISASPPKVKSNLTLNGSRENQSRKQSGDVTSLPVLTVQSLPQSNIDMSRIVVSQAGDAAELAAAPAVSLVTSATAGTVSEIQTNHADRTQNESTKLSEKDASETASDSIHTADLLSPLSDKSASTTPAYEVSSLCNILHLLCEN